MTDFVNENWKSIPKFEGSYEISDYGRVKSVARAINRKGSNYFLPERILKNGLDSHGYHRVQLSVNGKVTCKYIHQLVLEAFVRARNTGEECRHLNGNCTDNNLTNLAYGTKSDNMQDAIRHGTFPLLEKRPNAKLTRNQAIEIFHSQDSAKEISQKYGVGAGVARQIKTGETWSSITDGIDTDAHWNYRAKHTPAALEVILDRTKTRAEIMSELGVSITQIKYARKMARKRVTDG